MGIEERDWHRREIQDRQRRAEGVKYRNSDNWYYFLDGRWFGPCDKDNIMRLMRNHLLNKDTMVKQGNNGTVHTIGKLKKEFPNNGAIYTKRNRRKRAIHPSHANTVSNISVWGIFLGLSVFLIFTALGKMNGNTVFLALLSWAIPTEMKRIRQTKGVNAVYVILMVMLVLLVCYIVLMIRNLMIAVMA
ncbi:MAG: hypothetical protein LKE64_05565 [Solobacterium sp.]|nr:hypothetical protein [Solobacterium sp.]MCH4050201.1 hypothetical protein [Solobacterium sp.]MCH4073940.1 hypothetical protein [Solobacterium sp.]MCI1313468.1 hypothetical protein [Solobacterium sp.]MCI1345768.1 hypothetical protein [Solobacterium sp.]